MIKNFSRERERKRAYCINKLFKIFPKHVSNLEKIIDENVFFKNHGTSSSKVHLFSDIINNINEYFNNYNYQKN